MDNNIEYTVNIDNLAVNLPIMLLPSGVKIAFFNLHGNQTLTEHCANALAPLVADCEVIITAESKGLQLAHCMARLLGHDYYAVARKSKKLYMQDGIEVLIDSSITTGTQQRLYLSAFDARLLEGKRAAIVDDVISTGNSLKGLEELVAKAGGTVAKRAFVLAEGDAKNRSDIVYLDAIPIM